MRSGTRLSPTDYTNDRARCPRTNEKSYFSQQRQSRALKLSRGGQRTLHPTHPVQHLPPHLVSRLSSPPLWWLFGAHRPATTVLLYPFQRSQDQFLMRVAALVRVSAVRASHPPEAPVPQTAPTHRCIPLFMSCTSAYVVRRCRT